nr:metalloregulator ArsR/SmtB family transcription factor [uncultured Gellertiella sp.]
MDRDEILKALSHPVRVEILRLLKAPEQHFSAQHLSLENGVCAGQFERCGLSQSTISAHLASLTRAGLTSATRVGQWIFYKRNEETISAFVKELASNL